MDPWYLDHRLLVSRGEVEAEAEDWLGYLPKQHNFIDFYVTVSNLCLFNFLLDLKAATQLPPTPASGFITYSPSSCVLFAAFYKSTMWSLHRQPRPAQF